MKAPHNVLISPLDDGSFMVQVGCKTLSFKTVAGLVAELGEYLVNPEETVRRYSKQHGWDVVPGTIVPGTIEPGRIYNTAAPLATYYGVGNALNPTIDRFPGLYAEAREVVSPQADGG